MVDYLTYTYISGLEPTLSENVSYSLFIELLQQENWRCYSSKICLETESLIDRFLRSHAKLPGMLTGDMPAVCPIDVLYYRTPSGGRVYGANFLNGAVFTIIGPNVEGRVQWLLVENATAEFWRYPTEGYKPLPLTKHDKDDDPILREN